jgi:hypothetical protein
MSVSELAERVLAITQKRFPHAFISFNGDRIYLYFEREPDGRLRNIMPSRMRDLSATGLVRCGYFTPSAVDAFRTPADLAVRVDDVLDKVMAACSLDDYPGVDTEKVRP